MGEAGNHGQKYKVLQQTEKRVVLGGGGGGGGNGKKKPIRVPLL